MKAGDIISNRYELVSKLGSSSFEVVWMAMDHITDNIEVVIKIYTLQTVLYTSALLQFKKECMQVVDLHHPHLLTAKHFDILGKSSVFDLSTVDRQKFVSKDFKL